MHNNLNLIKSNNIIMAHVLTITLITILSVVKSNKYPKCTFFNVVSSCLNLGIKKKVSLFNKNILRKSSCQNQITFGFVLITDESFSGRLKVVN